MRLMIVPCAAAALSLWISVGIPEEARAFGDQTRGSSGFQGQFGEQPTGVGERRTTRTYRKRTSSAPLVAAQRHSRQTVPGSSHAAVYLRCRNAIFQAYGSEYVFPDGRRARSLPSSWSVGQIDACVMNGGKAI